MTKRALITGVSGQDGAYLSRLLLQKGYEVYGAVRRSSHEEFARLERLGIADDIHRVEFDVMESDNLNRVMRAVGPHEVYNLAAASSVGSSWDQPVTVGEVNALGVTRMLEAIRTHCPEARFYQASTSEMFGRVRELPQTEQTPFYPRSPYGVAKTYGHFITVNYRESFGIHASSGILFNHASPLRSEQFVTRKITLGLARVRARVGGPIELGNLSATRDWGYADDYVDGMWRMLQQDSADDFIIATGHQMTVREFAHHAAVALGFRPEWHGEGLDEICVDDISGTTLVSVNPSYFRPAEVDIVVGDATKARTVLGWEPTVLAPELAQIMAHADRDLLG